MQMPTPDAAIIAKRTEVVWLRLRAIVPGEGRDRRRGACCAPTSATG